MALGKVKRRIRCSMCNSMAVVGFGRRASDFLLCEAHYKETIEDIKNMGDFKCECSKALENAEPTDTEEVKEESQPVTGEYTCKWCGQKFPKSEYTLAQFTAHSKPCKKEHDGVPFSE